MAVLSSAASQFPRYVQLGSGGLGLQVQSRRQRALSWVSGELPPSGKGSSAASFSKRTLGSTSC